jgi:hypothetical protein
MIQRQEAQRAHGAARLGSDVLALLLADDGRRLQAQGAAVIYEYAGGGGGAGGAYRQHVGPFARADGGRAGQKLIRQINGGAVKLSFAPAYQRFCAGFAQKVGKLNVVQRRIQQQRLAPGGHKAPEQHRPLAAGVNGKAHPFACRAAVCGGHMARALQRRGPEVSESKAALLLALQPVGGGSVGVGAEYVEKSAERGVLLHESAFFLSCIFHD